ncbi:hypothetical protein GCM10010156_77440 [Planobispora rosea]|uniref:Uncharacterized protein n=2 Tax=Planobispora rosea TaxID=35762 RepID=A0A8J3SAY9_PLARO|nr:hypothetical protein GCM10010156_77440 [Planobispora rosea]GIH89256.1 hypothetical protein Pro02_76640 [Planobispora rosea]
MAWFRNDEQDFQQLFEEARQTRQEGRAVFVARLRSKHGKTNPWAAPEVADLIEGVEREGWELSHMAESLAGDAVPQMTCVFRRR